MVPIRTIAEVCHTTACFASRLRVSKYSRIIDSRLGRKTYIESTRDTNAKERKRHRKVGYFPGARASLVCHGIHSEIEHYVTYFVKGNTRGRAYCEIRTGYFSATGDTGPIRVVCGPCDVPLRCTGIQRLTSV